MNNDVTKDDQMLMSKQLQYICMNTLPSNLSLF